MRFTDQICTPLIDGVLPSTSTSTEDEENRKSKEGEEAEEEQEFDLKSENTNNCAHFTLHRHGHTVAKLIEEFNSVLLLCRSRRMYVLIKNVQVQIILRVIIY